MSGSRKTRVPMADQVRLINECRRSGLTDADWCQKNGIAHSTFYNWISRCRKAGYAEQINPPSYGHHDVPQPHQDVVPVDIISELTPNQHRQTPVLNANLDNSHTIEVVLNGASIRISNDADTILLSQTIRILREMTLC